MSITIRLAIASADYSGIAAVLSAENPEWPTTVEDLTHEAMARPNSLLFTYYVAEETIEPPAIIGVASVGHDPLAHREGKFKINIRVHPERQGEGIGARLYEALLRHLAPLAPRELQAEVWAAHPRAVRFVQERGFVEVWRRIDMSLDPTHFGFAAYASLEERLRARGMEITTYDALADDPARLEKLYRLDRELWRDVPYGEPVPQRPLAQFEQEEIDSPNFLPDACFIAIHDEAFIAYLNLLDTGPHLDINMTGVLPAYRQQGLATVLKVYAIRYARAHGNRRIWTVNDSTNTPMRSLNQRLGFREEGATIRFVKRLPDAS